MLDRVRLPSVTVVAGCGTMMPELRKPMKRDEQPDARRRRPRSSSMGMAPRISCRTPTSGQEQEGDAGDEAPRRAPPARVLPIPFTTA